MGQTGVVGIRWRALRLVYGERRFPISHLGTRPTLALLCGPNPRPNTDGTHQIPFSDVALYRRRQIGTINEFLADSCRRRGMVDVPDTTRRK